MPIDAARDGQWADRAAALYDESYAQRYRARDNELESVQSNRQLLDWLGRACRQFDHPIDALDLGCGTGRYFWGLQNVKSVTGIDVSSAMLQQARRPIHAERLAGVPIRLIQGDVMSDAFSAGTFDLVYSIGVLAEHVPLDRSVTDRVRRWLRPGGRFAFTTVHPMSPSVRRTLSRRVAQAANSILPEAFNEPLHRRLNVSGMYADERWIAGVLTPGFVIESLDRFASDVHLHGRCVARAA